MAWPWTRKQSEDVNSKSGPTAPPPILAENKSKLFDDFVSNANLSAFLSSASTVEKNFDWMQFQAMQGGTEGMFSSEYNLVPTMRITKGMMLQEPRINSCTNAISRQFLNCRYLLKLKQGKKGENVTILDSHPFLDYMNNAGSDVESSSFFTSNGIADIVLTGNNYWWTSPDLKDKRRIPAERCEPVIVANRITHYRIMERDGLGGGVSKLDVPVDEMVHIKMPNPFTPHIGLSMVIALTLPVLIDKYGREFVVGFFLRGGQTAGIIQSDANNAETLLRLARTIMQAFGGRKNMHADKILPKGTTWAGQGSNFGEMRLIEMMKENAEHFRSATGCTNTVLGIVDNVNRATAFAEMQLFWKSTILPLQTLWCRAIMDSPIWKRFKFDEKYELVFDNSGVEYIDDFVNSLEQDPLLAPILTVNERRERIGYKVMEGYDKLAAEITPAPAPGLLNFAFPQQAPAKSIDDAPAPETVASDPLAVWKNVEDEIQTPVKSAVALFTKEFGAWEQIIVDNLKSRDSAASKIDSRSDAFAKSFASKAIEPAMKAYDHALDTLIDGEKRAGVYIRKESAADRKAKIALLRERARQVVEDGIFENERRNFVGYSATAMDRVYQLIEGEFQAGKSDADVAASVRMYFDEHYGMDEAYPGQAETIVRTEFSSAISLGHKQFGDDLAKVTKRMAKSWVTLGDEFVRDSHRDCEDESPIVGDSAEVMEMAFSNGLRYPREPGSPAGEVVNCRCVVRFDVLEWAD